MVDGGNVREPEHADPTQQRCAQEPSHTDIIIYKIAQVIWRGLSAVSKDVDREDEIWLARCVIWNPLLCSVLDPTHMVKSNVVRRRWLEATGCARSAAEAWTTHLWVNSWGVASIRYSRCVVVAMPCTAGNRKRSVFIGAVSAPAVNQLNTMSLNILTLFSKFEYTSCLIFWDTVVDAWFDRGTAEALFLANHCIYDISAFGGRLLNWGTTQHQPLYRRKSRSTIVFF